MLVRILALFPFLERHEEERIVGTSDAAQETVTGNSGYFVDPRDVHQNFLDLFGSCVGPLERSGIWQGKIRIEIALVLVR